MMGSVRVENGYTRSGYRWHTAALLSVFVAPLVWALAATEQSASSGSFRFEVTAARELLPEPVDGRLIVALTHLSQSEPRADIGRVGANGTPIFGVDVDRFGPSSIAIIDDAATGFPVEALSKLSGGDYLAQAVLDVSRDLKLTDAPGNLFSDARAISFDPTRDAVVRLTLDQREPNEQLPLHTEHVRFVSMRSQLLSVFHGRPIYLRAGVILPRGFSAEPERRYPVRVSIGGYGSRYTRAQRLMQLGSDVRTAWLDDDAPRMIAIHLDGAGPYGDPYQVNSANNGPYGDAITQELIPYIENRFRGIGDSSARVVDGSSTGGWVSLALQIFYPDFFNGVWSFCPDGVDFRQLQLVNIYDDNNAFIDAKGDERPSARDVDGAVRFTMRHEVQMENVLGRGSSWTRSGQQWGAWNAVYGPRGANGDPKALWDPVTGVIDRDIARQWEQYDLRLVLARNWATLEPKLRGKINIWVGEADNYYLDNAVHLLDNFFEETDPSFDARIVFGPGKGHCWVGLSEIELMREMGERTQTRP